MDTNIIFLKNMTKSHMVVISKKTGKTNPMEFLNKTYKGTHSLHIYIEIMNIIYNGYLLPLANLATQTEFSQSGKVCSG